MDPSLIREKEAFKQRAMAVPVVEKKKEAVGKSSTGPKKKKKSSKLKRPKSQTAPVAQHAQGGGRAGFHPVPVAPSHPPEGVDKLKKAVLSGPRSNMPYRVLKAVVDMMGRRYVTPKNEPLTLEEILAELGLTDLRTDTREWLLQALKANPKIMYYPAGEKFLFKPALGLDVRNRRQLLEKLREYDREGLGGVLMSEVKEALPNPEKAVQKLKKEELVMQVVRPDKEEVVFYSDRAYQLPMAEEFRALWHRVSVDGLTETDIEKSLQSTGLSAMQGQARKRRAPTAGQKAKKSRASKVLNTHLDSSLLKDYSEAPGKPS